MKPTRRSAAAFAAIVTATAGLLAGTAGAASASGVPSFTGPLHHVTTLASTVPGNGDVNPYGVAVVPRSTGDLGQGNVLVSNFNNKANVQGTGTTIVEITPSGHMWQFAGISSHLRGCPGGVGLTTAMTIQFQPEWAGAAMYVLMAAILLVRPRGLFGEKWERFE